MSTLIFALTLAQSMPSAAPAATPPPPLAAQGSTHHALALEIATLLNSEALTRVQMDKMLKETMPTSLAANVEFAALEKEHPGLIKVLVAAMEPVLVRETISTLPVLWRRIAPLYARTFTTIELRELLAFYRSPTGIRLIDGMARGSDFSSLMGQVLDVAITSGDSAVPLVSAEGLRAGQASGIRTVIAEATAEDRAVLTRLGTSTVGRKLPALNREVATVAAAWGNERDPDQDARMEKVIEGAIRNHIEGAREK